MQKDAGPAIIVKNLHKSFGRQTVLNGIDLKIGKGETVAVLGRSGTGKSVLLKLIVGLHKPDDGSIQIHGQEITKLSLEELNTIRKRIGFLFQEAALYGTAPDSYTFATPRAAMIAGPDALGTARSRRAAI